MPLHLLCFSLLCFAAPPPGAELLDFRLDETPDQVAARLGSPVHVGNYGPGYFSWMYQIGTADVHDPSHTLCFRDSDKTLVSITRAFEDPEPSVDALFPEGSYRVHHWPDAAKPQYSVRVRELPGNRLLIAMGSAHRGDPCGQLVLMRRSALPQFLPWLAEQMAVAPAAR